MDLSIFLARLIGLVLVIVCLAVIFNRRHFHGWIDDVIFHPIFIFMMGSIDVILGLLIILVHNIWQWDWRVVVTLVGWLLLIRGIIRLFFPQPLVDFVRGREKMFYDNLILAISGIFLVIGLFLTYHGFKNVLFP